MPRLITEDSAQPALEDHASIPLNWVINRERYILREIMGPGSLIFRQYYNSNYVERARESDPVILHWLYS